MVMGHLVEEAAEELSVLGLLPEEGGQKHLLLKMPILRHRHHEWEQIKGDALLTRLEERGLQQKCLLLFRGAALPVENILREVDAAWVPGAEPFGLMIESHRENVVSQSACTGRRELVMNYLCH